MHGGHVFASVLVLCLALPVSGQAVAVTQNSKANAAGQRDATSALDGRVRALTKALDLDADQQSKVRAALQEQREQILKIWNDPTVPAAYRISATRAVADRTADQIRALLNEEQRKKFNPPRQPREPEDTTSVEAWMSRTGHN